MNGKQIVFFDGVTHGDKQAEGIAISEAVVNGKCNNCPFLKECQSNENFKFPEPAWCYQRKMQILKDWLSRGFKGGKNPYEKSN